MVTTKERLSDRLEPKLWAAMQKEADERGCDVVVVVQDAVRLYFEAKAQTPSRSRPEIMAHYQASLDKNRKLAELLAQ